MCYDSDANTVVADASSTVGAYFIANEYDGVICISGDPAVASADETTVEQQARNIACFYMGTAASIDFTAENGRIAFAFKHQSGLATNVQDAQIAANLVGNGYNFYGAYATANDGFNWLYNGNVSGRWVWADAYINQIFLNSQFQLYCATLLDATNAIDYSQTGMTLIRQALKPVIDQGLLSGIIRSGITLSSSQAIQVNMQAGTKIDDTLSTVGYYLQVKAPSAQDRGERKSPILNFWYTDGGAVQKIEMNSVDVM